MDKKKPILPKHIFWDIQVENLDFDKKKNFIIVRVFERGDFKEITQIRRYYGDDIIISSNIPKLKGKAYYEKRRETDHPTGCPPVRRHIVQSTLQH